MSCDERHALACVSDEGDAPPESLDDALLERPRAFATGKESGLALERWFVETDFLRRRSPAITLSSLLRSLRPRSLVESCL